MDHRRGVRRQCKLPFEVRTETSSFPIKGETSDVNLYGCYLQLLYTLPKDATVDLTLWVESNRLRTRAKVVTADANVGNGIEFLDMSEADRALLAAHLDKLDVPETDSGPIFR